MNALTLKSRYDRAFLPYVSSDLFDSQNTVWFDALLSQLPNVLSPALGFELSLAAGAWKSDFALFVNPGEPCQLLAGLHPERALPESWMSHPIWQRLRAFARKWAEGAEPWTDQMANLWLEFDQGSADMTAGAIPLPNVFLKFAHDCGSRNERTWRDAQYLLEQMGATPRPSAFSVLRGLVEKAGSHEAIFQIGTMLNRDRAPIRVCWRGKGLLESERLLGQLGWQGERPLPMGLLTRLEPLVTRADLALDIADDLLPRVGFECHIANPQQDQGGWAPLIELLVSEGWCTPAKGAALKQFAGHTCDYLERDAWTLHPERFHVVGYHRWIHHLKLDFDASGDCRVKAYLGVNQRGLLASAVKPLVAAQVSAREKVLSSQA